MGYLREGEGGVFLFSGNRQLRYSTRYDSLARAGTEGFAAWVLRLIAIGEKKAGERWADARIRLNAILKGFDFLKRPGLYGVILAGTLLIAGTYCHARRQVTEHTAVTARHLVVGERAPSPAWKQPVSGQVTAGPIILTEMDCKLQVTGNLVNIRSGGGRNTPEIGQACSGDILSAMARSSDGWYQIAFQGGTGWIAGWCVQDYRPSRATVRAPEPGGGTSGTIVAVGGASSDEATRGASVELIGIARRFLGTPYRYGAAGTASFDCSGFVRYVYACYGISLPRVASDQARVGMQVLSLAPGDLVFFSGSEDGGITHVGIYAGNNSFIHASFQGVTVTSLDDPWYREHYVTARRVIQPK
jgi:cell wall-associated NlpC family hydrolase